MFERYTESARRVIFFARYEASAFGSPNIDTEHLLLGLLRESPALFKRLLPKVDKVSVREEIEAHSPKREPIPTSMDLPLSNEAKQVLAYAAEEAERLSDRHIGTEHMLLALLRAENCFSARILAERDAKVAELRVQIAKNAAHFEGSPKRYPVPAKTFRSNIGDRVEIHGSAWKVDYVHDVVNRLSEYAWHWRKSSWKNRDIVIARSGGAISFDLSLAEDQEKYELVQAGWKKDHCAICRWELMETENADSGTGYTNGRDWLCTECYEKFWERTDFFSSPYPDFT